MTTDLSEKIAVLFVWTAAIGISITFISEAILFALKRLGFVYLIIKERDEAKKSASDLEDDLLLVIKERNEAIEDLRVARIAANGRTEFFARNSILKFLERCRKAKNDRGGNIDPISQKKIEEMEALMKKRGMTLLELMAAGATKTDEELAAAVLEKET